MLCEIEKGLKEPTRFKTGLTADFFSIDEKWGFKFFVTKSMALATYRLQKRAAKHGLAPQVGEFHTVTYCGAQKCGYLTEKARMLTNKECLGKLFPRHIAGYNELEIALKNLFAKHLTNPNNLLDLHNDNVGYINNNLVCIDFSGIAGH